MAGSGPKTALVLSAGGMFAAYQAGAWKALAGTLSVDIVVGVSAGALNAWAIAGGAGADELIRHWLDPACARLVPVRPAFPPRGLFDAKPLYCRIQELWEAYRPRTEIGIVAVEVRSLRSRLFLNDEITWRHLAASCAVPLLYPHVGIDRTAYTDGGLLGALPLWAAAAMGADRIIAINALPQVPSRLVRAAVSAVRMIAPRGPGLPEGFEVHLIAPAGPLGSARQALFWDEIAAERWIRQGETDARRVIEQIAHLPHTPSRPT